MSNTDWLIALVSPENPKKNVAVKYYNGYPDLGQAINMALEVLPETTTLTDRQGFVIWLYCLSPLWGITKEFRQKREPLRNLRLIPTLWEQYCSYINDYGQEWIRYYPSLDLNYVVWLEQHGFEYC